MKDYDFRPEDKVFSIKFGNGIVIAKGGKEDLETEVGPAEDNEDYPILVKVFDWLEERYEIQDYNVSGESLTGEGRDLYHGHAPDIILEKVPYRGKTENYNFLPGDKVFSLEFGNGLVSEIEPSGEYDPGSDVWVKFNGLAGSDNAYSFDGQRFGDGLRTLYHGHDLEVIVKEKPPTRENEHWLCVYHDLKNTNIARSIIYSSYAEAIEKSKEDWSDDWEIIHGPVKIETKEVESESI